MELRTLRYLLAVADRGTVTGAAVAMHITQPSLSRQLRQLEKDVGLDLFDRHAGRLRLSAAGRAFLPLARDLVTRADAALHSAHVIASGRMETVTIAAPGTTLTDVIAPFLATLEATDPMPTVWEELPVSIYDAIERGADLVIGTTPPPRRLEGRPLAQLPVWAYAARDHRWPGEVGTDEVTLDVLAGDDLLVLSTDFHPRRAIDQAVARDGLSLGNLREVTSAEVAQALAASGRGVAVVSDDPRFGLSPRRITGTEGPITISLYAAWEPSHHGAETITSIVTRLTRFCQERYVLSCE